MKLSASDTGSGPAAVLLHGQPGSAAAWAAVRRSLRAQMRVIVPDRPGYGRTGGRAVGFGDNARAVVGLLDDLGVERAVLAGHSWGTGVALAAAVEFPDRVTAAVLAAPVAPGVPAGRFDRVLAHRVAGPPLVRSGFALAVAGFSLPFMHRLARAALPTLQPDQVAATLRQWRADSVWKSFYAEQRAFVTELPLLAPRLASVTAPVTILSGTRDRTSPTGEAEALAASLPHARLTRIVGAGHLLPQQRPRLLAEAIAAAVA